MQLKKEGRLKKARECSAPIVALRMRGRRRLGMARGVGVSTTMCCPFQTFSLEMKKNKTQNGLEASSETVCMPKDNIPALDKEWLNLKRIFPVFLPKLSEGKIGCH